MEDGSNKANRGTPHSRSGALTGVWGNKMAIIVCTMVNLRLWDSCLILFKLRYWVTSCKSLTLPWVRTVSPTWYTQELDWQLRMPLEKACVHEYKITFLRVGNRKGKSID